MNKRALVLSTIKSTGLIAVLRTDSSRDLLKVAEALSNGGVKLIEVTMTTPGALDIIREATACLEENIFIGAGTVFDAESARHAILAGAEFIVGPGYDKGMVELCRTYGKVVIPGAFTPNEIINAWRGGADIVKVFPANIGGPTYFRDLKGPLPQIEILPTGGVDLDTAPEFIKAGAFAIAVGGALVRKEYIESANYEAITQNARMFIDIISKARAPHTNINNQISP